MNSEKEEKRLKAYVEEYKEETSDGMGLTVTNVEGGGGSVPDESHSYENRREWLEETDGGYNGENVWRHLAKQEYKGREPTDEKEELVFIEVPGWFASDDDDLSKVFTDVHKGSEIRTFAMLKTEASEGTDAYMFSRFYTNKRGWTGVPNKYGTGTVPRSLCTIYRKDGQPREVDRARIRRREALPESVNPHEADEDDYNWKMAIGAAYRRNIGEEMQPLDKAYEDAKSLPDKLQTRVEIGVDKYVEQVTAEGEEVNSDDLATVVNSLVAALEPGAPSKKDS